MAKTTYNLKWTNRLSKETGFVKTVKKKLGHFENTWEQTKAKKYLNRTMAEQDIAQLIAFGEGKDNDFEIVEVAE